MDRETELAVQVAGRLAQEYLRFLLQEPRRPDLSGEQHGKLDQAILDLAVSAFAYCLQEIREAIHAETTSAE